MGGRKKTVDRLYPPAVGLKDPYLSEPLLSEVSLRMMNASPENLDDEILNSIKEIFTLAGADRGGLLRVSENTSYLTHAWYDQGFDRVPQDVNLAPSFPCCHHHLMQGEVLSLTSLEDLPPEAGIDRKSFESMGVKSTLMVPLFLGTRICHFIAAQSLTARREWTAEITTQLRLFGEMIVSAIQRRESDLALRRTMDRLDLAAASAEAGLWELELETGATWATDKARELFGLGPEKLTLESFLQKIHPDDRELVHQAIALALQSEEPERVVYRLPAADGQVRWMASTGRLQKKCSADPARLMGVTLDVTRSKNMEQQLQEQLQEINRLREQLERENTFLRQEVAERDDHLALLGDSNRMQQIMAQIDQVAATESTVLIQGETGTGKELVAQTIHRLSARGRKVMIKVNCAALPAALVESELFGREKGAFTGALSRQAGRFELADGSTLLLDEIAEMPLDIQAKLLRVLQEGEFERLGGGKTIKVDVRVIAASNRDLAEAVREGRFRPDLYYRLNVFPILIPPLRERTEDIPKLVWEFVNEFGERMGKKIRRISANDMQSLMSYAWPGNIRELRNVVEHAMILSPGDKLTLHRLATTGPQATSSLTLEEVERRHIEATLVATHGRIKGAGGASELLGLNPSTLYSRIHKLGIRIPRS